MHMQHANAVIMPVDWYFHGIFKQNIDMFVQSQTLYYCYYIR